MPGDELSFSKVKVIKYCKRNFIRETKLNNPAVLAFEHKKQQKRRLKNLPITSYLQKSRRKVSKIRSWYFERFRFFENWVTVTTGGVRSGTEVCVCVVPKIYVCLWRSSLITSTYNCKQHKLNEQVYSKAKSGVVILLTVALCHAVMTVPVGKLGIVAQESYVVGSKSFRPDIQKPRQMENAVRDI